MPLNETIDEARRVLDICNACRYCEGFCAVFPAMEKRRSFADADLDYLANLCHDCRGCYHACQYAPPHEFGVNVPAALAAHRVETYDHYAWPTFLGPTFRRNGTLVALTVSLALSAVLVLVGTLVSATALFAIHRGPGAFYAVIPHDVMAGVASVLTLFIMASLGIGYRRFRQGTQSPGRRGPADWASVASALRDILTLRYLGGGGDGCNDEDDAFSQRRRIAHQFIFYGFLLCFAATCVATFYNYLLGLTAPYAYASLPVLLGLFGGIGLIIGTVGMVWLKLLADPGPRLKHLMGLDMAFLVLLFFTAVTGLLLMALRSTTAMGILLSVHLGFVLGLFFALPYSKFVHALYRFAALIQYHGEGSH